MTEYDLIRDWTLHGCVDEEGAKKVLSRLRLEEGWKEFLDHANLRHDLKTAETEIAALNKKIEQLESEIDAMYEEEVMINA